MSSTDSTPNSRKRAAGSSSSSSAGSSIQGKTRPCPRHVGHHPRGELNEKFFGSSSGNDSPVSMSVRVVENQERISPEGSSRKQEPLPSESARSRASFGVNGCRSGFRVPGSALRVLRFELFAEAGGWLFEIGFFRSDTTTSMSCSL